MSIGKRIKQLRKQHKFSQEYVANQIGSTKQAIYKYENEIVTNIPIDKIKKLASLFSVSPAHLMDWEVPEDSAVDLTKYGVTPISRKKIPLLGEIACGEPIYANEDRESYTEVGTDIKADFCLRAKGDSMINARILDGDIVFIRKQSVVNNGEIAAVIVGDEATLKRVYYYPESEKLILTPENPKYEPLVYVGTELEQVRILGKAVAFQSDVV